MKIIVCGAGEVGGQICRHLAREDCDLTVVDRDQRLVRIMAERLGISGISGEASDPDTLKDAGAASADLIIAATSSDHANIVTCLVAKNLGSKAWTMARLRNRSYCAAVERRFANNGPVDETLTPEQTVAEYAVQLLESPSLLDRRVLLAGSETKKGKSGGGEQAYLIGLRVDKDCSLLHTPLRQLSELFDNLNAVVVGFRRKGRLGIATPDDQLFADDEVYVCTSRDDFQRTAALFEKNLSHCRHIVLVGAGRVGTEIAQQLDSAGQRFRVKMIEIDRQSAERAADTLARTVVLHGDGLSRDMLEEAGVGTVDAVVAVTQDDKTNLLAASRAKRLSGGLIAVSLVNDPFLIPLTGPLEIDSTIDPRGAAISAILSRSRRRQVLGVGIIGDSEAEIIEVRVMSGAAFAGRRIRNASLPEHVMVGAVKRGGRIMKPEPDIRLEVDDEVAFFALAKDVSGTA